MLTELRKEPANAEHASNLLRQIDVLRLSGAVEPFMRDHPARTLAEAMTLLSREDEARV